MFNKAEIILPSFKVDTGTTVFSVEISLFDDVVNEKDEGFWLLIEVQNRDDMTIERSGLALVIIKDNDREFDSVNESRTLYEVFYVHAAISIGFALPVYETIEQNGLVDDLVFIVKDGNVKSEQVLKILVMATSGSADMGEL